MVISIGENVLVNTEDIVAILDMDSITVKERGKEIFQLAKEKIVYLDESELPRSCVVVCENGKNTIYVSPVNSITLQRKVQDSGALEKGIF